MHFFVDVVSCRYMNVNLVTTDDLARFKSEIMDEIIKRLPKKLEQNEWLKSKQVLEMLNISPGPLSNLRNSGQLPSKKLGGNHFYKLETINNLLNKDE